MSRYELNVEDISDLQHVLRQALKAEWPDVVYRHRYEALLERIERSDVIYIETSD